MPSRSVQHSDADRRSTLPDRPVPHRESGPEAAWLATARRQALIDRGSTGDDGCPCAERADSSGCNSSRRRSIHCHLRTPPSARRMPPSCRPPRPDHPGDGGQRCPLAAFDSDTRGEQRAAVVADAERRPGGRSELTRLRAPGPQVTQSPYASAHRAPSPLAAAGSGDRRKRSWRAGSWGQPPLQHERPRPARVGWQHRSRPPGWATIQPSARAFLGRNGAASPVVLGSRNWPPEAGNGEVATGREPSRVPAGVPSTPMRPSRWRRRSTRAGRRRSSARPWL
jgi:hypothetical protein